MKKREACISYEHEHVSHVVYVWPMFMWFPRCEWKTWRGGQGGGALWGFLLEWRLREGKKGQSGKAAVGRQGSKISFCLILWQRILFDYLVVLALTRVEYECWFRRTCCSFNSQIMQTVWTLHQSLVSMVNPKHRLFHFPAFHMTSNFKEMKLKHAEWSYKAEDWGLYRMEDSNWHSCCRCKRRAPWRPWSQGFWLWGSWNILQWTGPTPVAQRCFFHKISLFSEKDETKWMNCLEIDVEEDLTVVSTTESRFVEDTEQTPLF